MHTFGLTLAHTEGGTEFESRSVFRALSLLRNRFGEI
jgi:hypothetical protein